MIMQRGGKIDKHVFRQEAMQASKSLQYFLINKGSVGAN